MGRQKYGEHWIFDSGKTLRSRKQGLKSQVLIKDGGLVNSGNQMPRDFKPMVCRLVKEAFDRPGWIFEIKWDGFRAIAEVDGAGVRLYSRTSDHSSRR